MPESEMTPAGDIFSAYDWSPGICYRDGLGSSDTAVVGRLNLPSGQFEVRACSHCVLELERERETAALRYGWPYAPGEFGP